jgi:hypothetical protein
MKLFRIGDLDASGSGLQKIYSTVAANVGKNHRDLRHLVGRIFSDAIWSRML